MLTINQKNTNYINRLKISMNRSTLMLFTLKVKILKDIFMINFYFQIMKYLNAFINIKKNQKLQLYKIDLLLEAYFIYLDLHISKIQIVFIINTQQLMGLFIIVILVIYAQLTILMKIFIVKKVVLFILLNLMQYQYSL